MDDDKIGRREFWNLIGAEDRAALEKLAELAGPLEWVDGWMGERADERGVVVAHPDDFHKTKARRST